METKTTGVRGYKVFSSDWTCRGKQYMCPGKFEEAVDPRVCLIGMHFCKVAANCFKYYSFDPNCHVAEVIAYGDVKENGDKCCTNKLEIVREIPWVELLEIVNTGKGCTGLCNRGNRNSGNGNSGNGNSGDWNSGNRNSGDWNKTNFSNGCFNTVEPKIYLFNKPSDWTYSDWLDSEAYYLMEQIHGNVLEWVRFDVMTNAEKEAHPEAKITGGYLKKLDKTKYAVAWWRKLSNEQKAVIKAIPNFDKTIFKEITGIDVDND